MDTQSNQNEPISFTVDQAIKVSGFDKNRIYTLIKHGQLRSFKSGRRRFISAEALRDCIRSLESQQVAEKQAA